MYTHTNTLRQTEIESQRQRYAYTLSRVRIHIYTLVFEVDMYTANCRLGCKEIWEIISQFYQRSINLPMGFTIRAGSKHGHGTDYKSHENSVTPDTKLWVYRNLKILGHHIWIGCICVYHIDMHPDVHMHADTCVYTSLCMCIHICIHIQPIAERVPQDPEIISTKNQFSSRHTRIVMGFIIYYLVLISNPMGRIVVRWQNWEITFQNSLRPKN